MPRLTDTATDAAGSALDTAKLAARRRLVGLTQPDLARAAGLPVTAVRRIENGSDDGLLTLTQLSRIAGALGLAPADLLVRERTPDDDGILPAPVAELACLLLVANRRVSRDLAARALGWRLREVEEALAQLAVAAPRLGVRLVRHGYSVALVRHGDWDRVRALATLQRHDEVRRSTKARTARLIHALLAGDADAGTAPPEALAEARAGGLLAAADGVAPAIAATLRADA